MLRKIRNCALAISILYTCGILGSLELERITLSEALNSIIVCSAFCVVVIALEATLRFLRALVIVYARRRRTKTRKLAQKRRAEIPEGRIFAA